MIYFDLDGVIRDLSGYVGGGEPNDWKDPMPNGRRLMEYVEANLSVLCECPPTKYFDVINSLPFISILTCQPESWQPYTCCWIYNHIGYEKVDINFVLNAHEKLEFLEQGDVLVEDYPLFEDYSKIIIIDYPYNQKVKGEIIRIKEVDELNSFLRIKAK